MISTRIRALISVVAFQRRFPSFAIRRRPNRHKWMNLKIFCADEEQRCVDQAVRMTI